MDALATLSFLAAMLGRAVIYRNELRQMLTKGARAMDAIFDRWFRRRSWLQGQPDQVSKRNHSRVNCALGLDIPRPEESSGAAWARAGFL
jgi:hypothetical protein